LPDATLACHAQRSWPVPSGQPRTTPWLPPPALFPNPAGDNSARSGFGSKGSPVQIRPSRPAAQVNGPPPPTWTAEDGNARSTVEVVAEELGPSLRWATATTTRATRSQGESPALRTSHRPGRGPRDGPGGLVSVVATSHQVYGTQGLAPPAAPPTRRQGSCRRTCHRRCIASPRSLRPQTIYTAPGTPLWSRSSRVGDAHHRRGYDSVSPGSWPSWGEGFWSRSCRRSRSRRQKPID
jgi:hypothetical protein